MRKEMKAFSATNNSTLFTFLMASVQVFLHGLTGQDDIIIGTHSAGQSNMDGKHLVGWRLLTICLKNVTYNRDLFNRATLSTPDRTSISHNYK